VKSFWTWFDKTINGMAVLAGGVLVFISAAVCYSVVMRYFSRVPPYGSFRQRSMSSVDGLFGDWVAPQGKGTC